MFPTATEMLAAVKGLYKKRKHVWVCTGGWHSSTAWPGYYWTSVTCQNCWWERTFIISPHIHHELEGKTPAEFFEGIEKHVLAGIRIPFYRYYRTTNPWQPYFKDIRKNPLAFAGSYGMGEEISLIPGQLALFGDNENCNPWAKGKPMQPLSEQRT